MPKKIFDIIPPGEIEPISGKLDLKKEPPKHKKDRSKLKRIFLKGLIFCLVFLILILSSFYIFSKAEIEIWPETEILNLETTVTIDLGVEQADFEAGIIPGKIFEDQKSISEEFFTSGKMLKEEKARGIIRIYNASSTSSRTIVPSRFVSADGKLFWSVKKIVIPGATYEKGKLVPGEIDVEVQAAEPGEDYNIEPSTFALPALSGSALYTTIYGRSFSPMTGGFKGEVSQLTQEDFDKAENTLAEKLRKESKNFLKAILPTDFILLDEAVSQEIGESSSSVEVGAEAESFSLQFEISSKGIGFKKPDIEGFAKNFINLNISEDYNAAEPRPAKKIQEESLEINYLLESLDIESGKIVLNLEIKAKIYSDIDLTELKKALLGKSLKETEVFLENLEPATKVEIKSWPFLKKRIPENIEKVKIKLNLD